MFLQGKARVWFELQDPFKSYEQFRLKFEREFYSIPIQVKTKSAWANTKFNSESGNLQTFFYSQMKKANYLRPKLDIYERNFTIIQQLPNAVKKNLAAIDYNNTEAMGQVLANLDAIHKERTKIFATSESTNFQVQKVEMQNGYQSNYNRRRGNFHRSNRGFNNTGNQNHSTHYNNNNVSSNYGQSTITLPDTRVPPPIYNDNNRFVSRDQNNLNSRVDALSYGPIARQFNDFTEKLANGVLNDKDLEHFENNFNKIAASPHLLCVIKGLKIWSLIDSGSQVSAMSDELYNELNKNHKITELPVSNTVVLTAIGRKATSVRKQVYIEVEIDGKNIEFVFLLIPGLSSKLILGNNFNLCTGLIVNYWTREIFFKDKKIVVVNAV